MGKRTCDERGQDWDDAATGQDMSRTATTPEAGGGHGTDSPLSWQERSNPTDILVLDVNKRGPASTCRSHLCPRETDKDEAVVM